MSFPRRLVLATRNRGKVREILEICADWPVEWVTSDRATWPVAEEADDYLENARSKALAAASATGMPAVADDSGIEVSGLGGRPGPRSARFAGEDASDEANLRLLLERVAGFTPERRAARYRCVAVCAWPDRRAVWSAGTCEGRLILEPRGTGGFGYDPIFVPLGHDRTMAELVPEEKNALSHRGKALRGLRDILSTPEVPPQ